MRSVSIWVCLSLKPSVAAVVVSLAPRSCWRLPPPSKQPADLFLTGTTYSCVATYEGNNVEIIANEQGSFTTPSFVSFTEEERLIGEAAKNLAAMNPANTVFDVK